MTIKTSTAQREITTSCKAWTSNRNGLSATRLQLAGQVPAPVQAYTVGKRIGEYSGALSKTRGDLITGPSKQRGSNSSGKFVKSVRALPIASRWVQSRREIAVGICT